MKYKLEVPEGATKKERDAYIKRRAEENFFELMEESSIFRESTIRLWGRLGDKDSINQYNFKRFASMDNIRNDLMKNKEFRDEYDKLKPQFEIIVLIIKARNELNMTQEEFAKRLGVRKSVIRKLERGDISPTIEMLEKIAQSLDKKLLVSIE